jgi:hypothetical protein
MRGIPLDTIIVVWYGHAPREIVESPLRNNVQSTPRNHSYTPVYPPQYLRVIGISPHYTIPH